MLTLFDYLPSQNAWKVRVLLAHLGLPYITVPVSIFEGEGRTADFLAVNPTGKVPALRLEDGRTLAESNAILAYLAEDTAYLPSDRYGRAKVHQWLSFEQEHIESTIGSLRYWTLTGKLAARAPQLVSTKRSAALSALKILDTVLSRQAFVAGDDYTIADISIHAYGSLAGDAGIDIAGYRHFVDWLARVEAQPGFVSTVYPYSIDEHAGAELPG